jgi:hypothetical protein
MNKGPDYIGIQFALIINEMALWLHYVLLFFLFLFWPNKLLQS